MHQVASHDANKYCFPGGTNNNQMCKKTTNGMCKATELACNGREVELTHQVASLDANKYCVSGEKPMIN